MMKLSVLLSLYILIPILFYNCSVTKVVDQNNNKLFAEAKEKFAPDSRVAVFDISGIKKGKNIVLKGETTNKEAKEFLIKIFMDSKMNVTDSIKMLPEAGLKENFAIVRVSVSNLRTKPQHSAELATQAIMGTPLKVLRNDNNWSLVQTPDQYIAWVDNSGIELMNEGERKKWLKIPKLIANVQNGLITESEEIHSNPVSDFVIGSIVGLKGESIDKKFWIVTLPDNRIAYADKKDFQKIEDFYTANNEISSDDLINDSYQFLGSPYLWGGTSSKGMDCSGFTKTVFFINGFIIPRDASQQVKVGDPVKLDEAFSQLLSGDLLFFGNKRPDNSDSITHVGIYLGEGRFIHSSGIVKIESLLPSDKDYSDFRAKSLLQARRYINCKNQSGIYRIQSTYGYY
ncbi:MAG: NlpC/P60 family protein [Deltaproteobacteria bacterium]